MKLTQSLPRCLVLSLGIFLAALTLRAQASEADEPLFVGEELYYQVSYSGFFSAFSRIAVADAELSTDRYQAAGQSSPLLDTTLTVSTAAYEFVEGLYPFRYRMRTLYQLSPQGSVAFERVKKTRKSKYDLVWVEREPGMQQASIRRYRRGDTAVDEVLPESIAHWADAKSIAVHYKTKQKGVESTDEAGVLDWLSLLQALRGLTELPSEDLLLPVTDGNAPRNYRVSHEGVQALEINGRSWSTRKYSLTQLTENGEAAKNPIKVWLSADDRHLPLRLQTSHAVGRFIIEYRDQVAAQPISVDTPIQVADADDDY